ncbi:MAG: hypothetical protein HYZ31_02230 [Gammaproteobacteria bacterium]|nr:hypothetical protein [Gammaproteobacteria bacterium]
MALLWQKKTHNTHYEVRTAGNSLRLYTNGVFHSQYHPEKPLTGYVWDLLMLPVFFYPPDSIKRVLVLGVGGGAVFHSLRHFIRPELIVGVELDDVHVKIARRFFELKGRGIELHTADALHWMQHYVGEKFDLIIDDVFAEQEGQPMQVTTATQNWLATMRKHLSAQGMIVKNFVDQKTLATAIRQGNIKHGFRSLFVLSGAKDQNQVAVFMRGDAGVHDLRQHIKTMPQLAAALKSGKLKYAVRRL